MRNLIFTLLLLLFPLCIFSQKKYNDAVSSALRVLKVHHSSLAELSPFDESGMENIQRLNRKVEEKLLELLNTSDALDLEKDTIPFFSCESVDKNFAVFNWQENLGGTFRTFVNIFYWKNQEGVPHAVVLPDEFAPYDSIYQIKNDANETLYLLIGKGIGCLSCGYERALLLKRKKLDLEEIFSFQIDYRLNNDIKGLNFDEKNKILSYKYIEMDCEDEEGENCWVEGKFQFDGKKFSEIED